MLNPTDDIGIINIYSHEYTEYKQQYIPIYELAEFYQFIKQTSRKIDENDDYLITYKFNNKKLNQLIGTTMLFLISNQSFRLNIKIKDQYIKIKYKKFSLINEYILPKLHDSFSADKYQLPAVITRFIKLRNEYNIPLHSAEIKYGKKKTKICRKCESKGKLASAMSKIKMKYRLIIMAIFHSLIIKWLLAAILIGIIIIEINAQTIDSAFKILGSWYKTIRYYIFRINIFLINIVLMSKI